MSEKKYPFSKVLMRIIPLHFRSNPWMNVFFILLGFLNALIFTGGVIATKNLFDTIASAVDGQLSFIDCFIPLLLMASAIFGNQILECVFFLLSQAIWDRSVGALRLLQQRKISRLDPILFEQTQFLDDLTKGKEGAPAIPGFVSVIFEVMSNQLMYFIMIGAYLFWLKPLLVVALLISFVPALLSQIIRAKVYTRLEEESAPIRRENEYYEKAMTDREYFKETRILGAFSYFYKLFADTLSHLSVKMWRADRRMALLELAMDTTTFAGMAVSSYLLFSALMAGEISVGAFAAIFATLGDIFNTMWWVMVHEFGQINQDIGKVTNFVKLLDLPELSGSEATPDFTQGIVADNVSFTYPDRDEPAVRNLTLRIADGETIAIVGENGAGKSTLVRLLAGLYRPSDGTVHIGGMDTSSASAHSIYQATSGVFQRYQRYKMTMADNVSLSNKYDSDLPDLSKIDVVLKDAGAEFDASVGEDTMLSPEFGGIDLSGGQWQRLAIARGLYRSHAFILLDEPTAAIDPIEETRIYTQFKKLAADKCAVVVTHRLGSARLANRILVMEAGEIVDEGTHEELMSRPGKYKDMWAVQAKWYERPVEMKDS